MFFKALDGEKLYCTVFPTWKSILALKEAHWRGTRLKNARE